MAFSEEDLARLNGDIIRPLRADEYHDYMGAVRERVCIHRMPEGHLCQLKEDSPVHQRRTVPVQDGEVLDRCPTCSTAGPAVYVAAQHPTWCKWMIHNTHRCAEHDELLLPSETACPHPDVPEEWTDPHTRLGVR